MPIYRFSRYIITNAIEIEASSPQEAQTIIDKKNIQIKGDFSHTIIEELQESSLGYKQETTQDILGA